jgi:nicotinamidase-related amidase
VNVNDFEIKKTALLFFDILNGYYHGLDENVRTRLKPMVDNAVRLMKTAREHKIPIMFAKGDNRPDSAVAALVISDMNYGRSWSGGEIVKTKPMVVAGEWTSEVIPELDPRPEDFYFTKHRWSAFHQTYLDLALRTLGVDTVIISGASTYIGVAPTVYAGRDLGYHFIVVRDACSATNKVGHDAMMDVVFPCMARVRTTDEVLAMIQGAKSGS